MLHLILESRQLLNDDLALLPARIIGTFEYRSAHVVDGAGLFRQLEPAICKPDQAPR